MKKILCLLAALSAGVSLRATAQIVSAPLLEAQSTVQTGLQNTMKVLSNATNGLVSNGVHEQELTKAFSEQNMTMAKTWYDGLLSVSSAVRDYRRVKSIFEKQGQIISTYSTTITTLRKSPYLPATQLTAMNSVYSKLLLESANTVSDLQTVVSPAIFKMSDAERLRFIDQLDTKITNQLSMVMYFTNRNLATEAAAKQQVQDRNSLLSILGGK